MSHRDDCPSRWEAERKGRDAAHRHYSSYDNPYRDQYGNEQACPEAESAWSYGLNRERDRMEDERREEQEREWAAQRAAEYQRQSEQDYYEAQQQEEQPVEEPDPNTPNPERREKGER